MKWNKTLTAQQVGLLVTGLEKHPTIDAASMYLYDLFGEDCDNVIDEAQAITEALQAEIQLVDPHNTDVDERVLKNTNLIIASRWSNGEEGYLDALRTTITRESAAQWFLSVGAIDQAKILMPSIETGAIALASQNNSKDSSQDIARTPEPSLINSLGIMAIMLAKKQANLSRNNRPNASQIVIAIEQTAAEHGFSLEQISNLQKDISMAVKKVLGETG
jgi:hypothetical protein